MEVCEESRAAPMNSSSSSSGCEMNSECPHAAIVKGRRTKRPRVHQSTFSGEEEDLALCLMLLAQGGAKTEEEDGGDGEKLSSERLNSNGKTGAFLYECKTCSKCFPSFQALGGHRSSHKKLKTDLAEEKGEKDENFRLNLLPIFHTAANSEVNGKTRRMHECSICGLEFSSGQALGGHMRRHRAVAAAPQKDKKEKCSISLDLNLPAPADEEREHFRDFIFSAPALVDCHY